MFAALGRGMQRARQRAARIGVRLAASALLLVCVPIGGVLYLGAYERHLLDAQERGMVQQARLLAAALGAEDAAAPAAAGPAVTDTGGAGARAAGAAVVRATTGDAPAVDAAATDPQRLRLRARAAALIARLDKHTEARLRILDAAGLVIADSSASVDAASSASAGRGGESESRYPDTIRSTRERMIYRVGLAIVWAKRLVWPRSGGAAPATETAIVSSTRLAPLPEVRAALAGRYGAATRLSGNQRSVTLSSALPIRGATHRTSREGDVIGAVLVSQSTHRLLAALYDVRVQVFQVVLFNSLVVATALSIFLTASIAHPLRTLSREASALVEKKRRLASPRVTDDARPVRTFAASARHDEVGDLARVLETVIARFDAHIQFVEAFSADVAHELKNPIAAIRTVAEMLATIDDPRERARFAAMLARDVERLDRLVTGLREVALVDAQLDREPAMRVDLGALLANIVEARRLDARQADGVRVTVESVAPPLVVHASPDRLAQVFDNLVENAVSFSPPGGTVTIALARDAEGFGLIRVDDEGRGIAEGHLTRIFDRFFTYRPATHAATEGASAASAGAPAQNGRHTGHHTGLGLAIAKAIVDGYGGTIVAVNRSGDASSGEARGGGASGARFEVRLPLA